MSRLTKGMFDGKTSLFGLRSGVYKDPNDFIHNGGWYNAAGERLGWGDLSRADLGRIAKELEQGELFIILRERDKFRVRNTEEPGPEHVAEFCIIIIAPGIICAVQPERDLAPTWGLVVAEPLLKLAMTSGVELLCISRKEARRLILGHDGTRLGQLKYFLQTHLKA